MKSRFVFLLVLVPAVAAASPRAEVQVDVLGLLDHRYGVSATTALSPDVALSIGLSETRGDPSGQNVAQVSLSLPIFAHPGFRGLFVEPGVLDAGVSSFINCFGCGSSNDLGAELLVGWSWVLDSGLALAVAAGPQVQVACYGGDCGPYAVGPTGYFKLGYAF